MEIYQGVRKWELSNCKSTGCESVSIEKKSTGIFQVFCDSS